MREQDSGEKNYRSNTWKYNLDIFQNPEISRSLWKRWLKDYLKEVEKIKLLYNSPKRIYHKREHILDCMDQLFKIKHNISEDSFIELFLAILFHDIVYEIWGPEWENEHKSAELAQNILERLNIKWDKIKKIKNLILLTISHTTKDNDKDGQYMIDIDLSIMGRTREQYQKYMKGVEKEYSAYPKEIYLKGRKKFLNKILPKKIFQTKIFQERYESKAKDNIKKEIKYLENKLKNLKQRSSLDRK